MNKRTFDCVVFETGEEARAHGIGGIWYDWTVPKVWGDGDSEEFTSYKGLLNENL